MLSPLNTSVSLFRSATDTIPATVNLLSWLTEPNPAQFLVTQIRATTDKYQRDQFKKQLPAITPSGTFTRRAKGALIQHSGLIAFDIDNVGDSVSDIKASIANIPNIAYCALSVSGNGLWGLIPISNPIQHEAHFRAIDMAFQTWGGVTIDPSCKDVSRLRFCSYDPEPYINHEAVTFTATYTPAPIRTSPVSGNSTGAIERAVRMVLSSRDGEKWITLTKASFLLGGYIAGGSIDEHNARTALRGAIHDRGCLDVEAAYRTIDKGLKDGAGRPIH